MEKQFNQNLSGQSQQSRKVALYCRVASRSQADAGAINIQMEMLRNYAHQQGYAACMEYCDDGFSGNSLDRPAFMEMDKDIKSGKVDTVIAKSFDRIARNYLLAENWLDSLAVHDVKFIAADGSHDHSVFSKDFIQELMRYERNQKQKNGKATKVEGDYV